MKFPFWFIIFLTAYLLRLAYIIEISDRPYFTAPAVDAEYHDDWAQEIAEGDLSRGEPFFRAPLYPFLLGAIYAVFGYDYRIYFIIRVIQALIGSLTCVLIYLLGKKLFSKRVGIIAGFAAAFTGIFIYFEAELLIPVILLPLDLGMILLLLKAREGGRNLYWWLSGLLFGLSAIARPNIIIIAPLVIFLVLQDKKIKRACGRIGFISLGFIIPLIPVTYHNIHQGEFVLIATQGGVNFYIGNNPQSDGATAEFPGLGNIWRYIDATDAAELEAGKELTASEVSQFYYAKGFKFIAAEPFKWLKLMAVKTLLYFGGVEISNNKNIYFAAKDSILLTILLEPIGFRVFAPLGVLGLILFYRRNAGNQFVFWFVILYSASVIMFFITTRYRLPIIPFLIIFTIAAVEWFIARIRAGDYRELINPSIVLAGLFIVVNINWLNVQKISPVYSHFSLGNAYSKQGQTDLAEKEYLTALAADPHYPQVHLNLGVIYYDRGDYHTAEQEFYKEIEINHGFESAYAFNNIGNIRVRQNKLEEALHFYQIALDIYPNYPDGIVNIARTHRDLGILKMNQDSLTAAQSHLENALIFCEKNSLLCPGDPEIMNNLARANGDLGLLKIRQDSLRTAKEYLAEAVKLNSGDPMYRYNYGLVLGELGNEEEAIMQMREALKLNPNFKPALEVIEAYNQIKSEESPSD
ncbi:MAG: tetratricopeptide repeat protein [candidate division Zixibacteria bacterium]|nr:tetratricopeptide repeat protein [Candidatus Tariuqbacter arcticus]